MRPQLVSKFLSTSGISATCPWVELEGSDGWKPGGSGASARTHVSSGPNPFSKGAVAPPSGGPGTPFSLTSIHMGSLGCPKTVKHASDERAWIRPYYMRRRADSRGVATPPSPKALTQPDSITPPVPGIPVTRMAATFCTTRQWVRTRAEVWILISQLPRAACQ